eukprot:Filipodium_phascolosomae@DN2566_c0_g1_i10.p2
MRVGMQSTTQYGIRLLLRWETLISDRLEDSEYPLKDLKVTGGGYSWTEETVSAAQARRTPHDGPHRGAFKNNRKYSTNIGPLVQENQDHNIGHVVHSATSIVESETVTSSRRATTQSNEQLKRSTRSIRSLSVPAKPPNHNSLTGPRPNDSHIGPCKYHDRGRSSSRNLSETKHTSSSLAKRRSKRKDRKAEQPHQRPWGVSRPRSSSPAVQTPPNMGLQSQSLNGKNLQKDTEGDQKSTSGHTLGNVFDYNRQTEASDPVDEQSMRSHSCTSGISLASTHSHLQVEEHSDIYSIWGRESGQDCSSYSDSQCEETEPAPKAASESRWRRSSSPPQPANSGVHHHEYHKIDTARSSHSSWRPAAQQSNGEVHHKKGSNRIPVKQDSSGPRGTGSPSGESRHRSTFWKLIADELLHRQILEDRLQEMKERQVQFTGAPCLVYFKVEAEIKAAPVKMYQVLLSLYLLCEH